MMERKPRILVIGSINMDLVLQISSLPARGESKIGEQYQYSNGGKGANQAVAAALLGADCKFIGKIGKDANGYRLGEILQTFGVDTSELTTDSDLPTGLAVVVVEPDGSNRIMVFPGSNMNLSKEHVVSVVEHESFDALIIQFEIPQETVIAACQAAMKRGIAVVVDAGPAKPFPLEKIAGMTVLSPNETETEALCGIYPDTDEKSLQAAKLLMKKASAKYVVIKRGKHGAYVYGGGLAENFDARKVKAVDTTAAGDAFTAALTMRLLETGDIVNAVRYGNCAGALTATRQGALSTIPSKEAVEQFMLTPD